jgi:hypothetical protein
MLKLEYLGVLNAACGQLSRGREADAVEQAARALRAFNPEHVLLTRTLAISRRRRDRFPPQ